MYSCQVAPSRESILARDRRLPVPLLCAQRLRVRFRFSDGWLRAPSRSERIWALHTSSYRPVLVPAAAASHCVLLPALVMEGRCWVASLLTRICPLLYTARSLILKAYTQFSISGGAGLDFWLCIGMTALTLFRRLHRCSKTQRRTDSSNSRCEAPPHCS